MADPLRSSFKGDVLVWRQFGPNDVRRVGVPCLVGVTVDVDELLNRLGEKALKSKGKRATAFHGALILQVKELPSDGFPPLQRRGEANPQPAFASDEGTKA